MCTKAMKLVELINSLHDVEAVKFGTFTLKSGISSPIYFDLRVIVSYPELLVQVADIMCNLVKTAKCNFDSICGVPYTALPIASVMSVKEKYPMLVRRKETKDYGTKKMIEGKFKKGDSCLIVEDVVTSGSSVLETAQTLEKEGLAVRDAVVLLDREQGGWENLSAKGITLHSVCTLSKLCEVLQSSGRLGEDTVLQVQRFIQENSTTQATVPQPATITASVFDKFGPMFRVLPHRERAERCQHPLSKALLNFMADKKTNLAVSADLTTTAEILKLADDVGPYICVLKTHIDIIQDFSQDFVHNLSELADKHKFLIFEDRKFADIGHTVQLQYEGGVYRIADWAHIINAHIIPGPGIIQGLRKVGIAKARGCLLLAQMSSKGNLADSPYTHACVKMAEENKDFIMGFICQEILSDSPDMIHMTPGVQLAGEGDGLGQQYSSPHEVVFQRGCDVIIVGRGILQASDRAHAAKLYRDSAYQAFQELLQLHQHCQGH